MWHMMSAVFQKPQTGSFYCNKKHDSNRIRSKKQTTKPDAEKGPCKVVDAGPEEFGPPHGYNSAATRMIYENMCL